MAQIDLKNATIYIRDGYSGPGGDSIGAINNVAGYAAGATVLAVDGFVGALAVNDLVTIVGSVLNAVLVKHRIIAHSETSTNTTSITITPALAGTVVENALITVLPHQIEVKIGEGNLTYSEKRNIMYTRDRGRLDTVREGDEDPVDVSMEAIWEFIKADSPNPPTIEDALKKRGQAVNWVSTSVDQCEPYAVDIVVEYDTPCATDDDEIITLRMFRYEEIGHDLRAAQFNIKGKCNVKEADVVRL
jgi:hypothetical protein